MNIKADNTQAMEALREVDREVQNVGRSGREAGASIGDKFSAINNIVGGLLPRQFQTLIRRFQSTGRAVTRAGKAFKFLSSSIAAIGIPLLIVAIQALIDNWEKVTDILGFTSEETRLLAKETEELNKVMLETSFTTEKYSQILLDLNERQGVRVAALKQLQRLMPELNGLDLEAEDAQERINTALERYNLLQEKKTRLKQIDERVKKSNEELKSLEREFEALQNVGRARYKEMKAIEEAREANNALIVEQQQLVGQVLFTENEITEEIEERKRLAKEAADQARKDAKDAADAARELASRLEQEAKAVERITKMREQAGLTEKELAQDEMRRKEEAELALVKSEKAKNAIREFYANEWSEWLAGYNEREAQAQEQAQAKIDAATEKAFQKRNQADMDGRERELMANAMYYDELETYAEQNGIDTTQLLIDRRLEEERINAEYNQRALDEQADADKKIQDAQTKIDEALAKDDPDELDPRTKDIMANEVYYQQLLDMADEYGLNREEIEKQRQERLDQINAEYRAKDLADEEAMQEAKVQAQQKAAGEFANLVGTMSNLAEEGSAQQKNLAVIEVLTQQAIAMANAVAAAVKAGSKPVTPATPFIVAANIVSMVGGVVSTFGQIKKILSSAGPGRGGSGIGGGGGGGSGDSGYAGGSGGGVGLLGEGASGAGGAGSLSGGSSTGGTGGAVFQGQDCNTGITKQFFISTNETRNICLFIGTVSKVGGASDATFTDLSGCTTDSLPEGLTLTKEGSIIGEPSQPGDFDLTVTATNCFGTSSEHTFTIKVIPERAPNPEFQMDTSNPQTSSANACVISSPSYSTMYHNGILEYPVIYDMIFSDPEGLNLYNGNNQWFLTENGVAILVDADGIVTDTFLCGITTPTPPTYSSVSLAYGSDASAACSNTTFTTYYHDGTLGVNPGNLYDDAAGTTPSAAGNYKYDTGGGFIQFPWDGTSWSAPVDCPL